MDTPTPILLQIPERITGSLVEIRGYRPDDARPLWQAVEESRDGLELWLPWAAEYRSLDDAHAWLARAQSLWLTREELAVGIFDRHSGRYLGGSGLVRINWAIPACEIGYWIRKTAEGHGYVNETVQILTRLAFETLGMNRLMIRMNARNERSRHVAERLGFVFEGTLRNYAVGADGRPTNQHVFSLIPEEYGRLSWRLDAEQHVGNAR